MADLVITDSNVAMIKMDDINIETRQAGEDIDAGEIIREHATTGKWVLAAGDTSSNAGNTRFMALKTVKSGQALTGFRGALIEVGDVFGSNNFGAPVYLSDTPGKLSLTAGDSTTTTIVGRIASAGASSSVDRVLRLNW